MTTRLDMTIGDIVTADHRAAAVFDRYGLDFCCQGRRTLDEGCRNSGVDTSVLLDELDTVLGTPASGVPRFNKWDPPALVSYIVANHHAYVREAIPSLLQRTRKIADVHGRRRPELEEVAARFQGVAAEMSAHMMKEERTLFPFVVHLASSVGTGTRPPAAPFGSVENPLRMMEAEHESAGAAMTQIRQLTSGYRPPDDACATYRVCLQELQAFELDLHEHVHLENNILFPMARRMEAQLSTAAGGE